MRKHSVIAVVALSACGLWAAARTGSFAAEPAAESVLTRGDVVLIAIRANVQADSSEIRLADVANISGGDLNLRNQLKQLDLEDGLSPGESVTILPPQIEFRIRLAGIDLDRVSIRGGGVRVTARATSSPREPRVVTSAVATGVVARKPMYQRSVIDLSSVSLEEGPLEREILQAAKLCVLSKLPWASENVDIRLAQPVPMDVRQVDSAVGYECLAELRSSGPPVGRVQIRVVAEASQKQSFDLSLVLDVRHYDRVVLTTKSIERGRVINASDLYLDRQDVTELTDYCSNPDQLVGSMMKRSIRALQPMKINDVESATHSEKSVVIKRREQVKMIARIGSLNVIATGESLQDGRVGDVIRLRNTDSNANVQGRVIAPGEVEISY